MPAQRIDSGHWETWRPGYAGATLRVYIAGTTTLASLFSDEALTVAASNPVVLETLSEDGVQYGKLAVPLYTSSAHYTEINSTDQTGINRPPLTTLAGADASASTVTRTGGSTTPTLAGIVARTVHAADFGVMSTTVAATTTATLAAAIGAAAALGGGEVIVPPGTYPFNQLTLSAGVVLRGHGRGVTILQSQVQGNAVTLSGDRAGFAKLTLDGVDKQSNSVGVFSKANDETYFNDVNVKRFATGLHYKGGRRQNWNDLYLTACTTNAKLHGDLNAGDGSDGDEFRDLLWIGGKNEQSTSIGIDLSWEDKLCLNNHIVGVEHHDNTGQAIRVNGARYTYLDGCAWKGNTGNLQVLDDTNTSNAARLENTVIGLFINGGTMEDGTATFTNTCQSVIFQGVEIKDVDFTLSTPINNPILLIDCTEDSDVTIAGEGSKLSRYTRINDGQRSGVTTDATTTKAWSIALQPGQIVYLEAKVLGRQRNAAANAAYHRVVRARRPGSTLAYDTQTGNFTAGLIVTGQSSGARARIQADSDSGTTGTLTLIDIEGEFLDNETITDTSTGSALVNGTLTSQNAALLGSVETIGTIYEDDSNWDATFAANGTEIELRVTGAASKTVEWDVDVEVTSN